MIYFDNAATSWPKAPEVASAMTHFLEEVGANPTVTIYGGHDATRQTATVSFTIEGMSPSEIDLRLDEEYGIMCRIGLHCSPAAHKTIRSFPTGTVRFGLAAMNTRQEVGDAIGAVRQLAQEAR